MNAQEVFNEAYTRIIKQGEPAARQNGNHLPVSCYYQTADGLHCGVGILMNEAELAAYGNFTGSIFSVLEDDEDRKILRPFFREHNCLLGNIQQAHDISAKQGRVFLDSFKASMATVAFTHDLEVPDA